MERILEDVEKLCFDKNLLPIIEKVANEERLSFGDGLTVMDSLDLNTVGMLADYVKRKRVGDKVYFVVNRHVNPSNICAISCRFCAFGTTKKSANAYEMSHEQILSLLNDDIREVHIVGGLHPDWNFDHYLDIIRLVKNNYPKTHVKAFTAVEIDWFTEITGKGLEYVLETLREAGVDALRAGARRFSTLMSGRRYARRRLSPQGGRRFTSSPIRWASRRTRPFFTATSKSRFTLSITWTGLET
ncbi:MAG: radical SAM protein [Thermodesulfobacteriota bacterium]